MSPAGDPQSVVPAGKIAPIERRRIMIARMRKSQCRQPPRHRLWLEEAAERFARPGHAGRKRGQLCTSTHDRLRRPSALAMRLALSVSTANSLNSLK